MTHLTFHFVVAKSQSELLHALRSLPSSERPLYVGQTHHWIHSPQVISVKGLVGDGATVTKWDHLLIFHSPSAPESLALPSSLVQHISHKWSIAAPAFSDDAIAAYPAEHERRTAQPIPPLPPGWSALDHSGLDASDPPPDLEASLGLTSYPLGANRETDRPIVLKDYFREFGKEHAGPVQMSNLDSTNPGRRRDFYGYIQAFGASIGIRYGGEAAIHGTDPTDWSSREAEGEVTVAEARRAGRYGVVGAQVVGW